PVGLLLRERLLGLPAGRPRAAVRAGIFQPAAVADAGVVLPAEFRDRLRRAVRVALHRAASPSFLPWRLLRSVLRTGGVLAVVLLRAALPRPAFQLLQLAEPRRSELVRGAAQQLLGPAQRRPSAAAPDVRSAECAARGRRSEGGGRA